MMAVKCKTVDRGSIYIVNLIGTIVSRETEHTRNMWTKSYSLFLLIWLFTIVNSSILEEKDDFDRKCVMGKTFYDGCNWCSCGRKHIACTMRACYDPETGGSHKPKKAPEDFWENI